MRLFDRSSAFKRDYKREARDKYRTTLDSDLRLVYRKPGNDTLRLARLGSHGELFG
ncbi:MAG: hypothetical protein Q8O52_06550 [Sulfuritalea sp.]|nr:hypothetical protein [Sulfuritalea sp.]